MKEGCLSFKDLCSVGKSKFSLLATIFFLPKKDLCNQDLNRDAWWITIATGAWQPGLDWWPLIYGIHILPKDVMHGTGHPNVLKSPKAERETFVFTFFCLTGLCLPQTRSPDSGFRGHSSDGGLPQLTAGRKFQRIWASSKGRGKEIGCEDRRKESDQKHIWQVNAGIEKGAKSEQDTVRGSNSGIRRLGSSGQIGLLPVFF